MGVLILQMCFVWQALALDPQASSYLRADFTVEQGLPDDKVNAIAQTPNGFLWVGTDGGLARFDGGHFTQIRLRAGISKDIPVSFLLTAADGRFGWAPIPGLSTYRPQLWTTSLAGDHESPGRGLERSDPVPAHPQRHSVGGNPEGYIGVSVRSSPRLSPRRSFGACLCLRDFSCPGSPSDYSSS